MLIALVLVAPAAGAAMVAAGAVVAAGAGGAGRAVNAARAARIAKVMWWLSPMDAFYAQATRPGVDPHGSGRGGGSSFTLPPEAPAEDFRPGRCTVLGYRDPFTPSHCKDTYLRHLSVFAEA